MRYIGMFICVLFLVCSVLPDAHADVACQSGSSYRQGFFAYDHDGNLYYKVHRTEGAWIFRRSWSEIYQFSPLEKHAERIYVSNRRISMIDVVGETLLFCEVPDNILGLPGGPTYWYSMPISSSEGKYLFAQSESSGDLRIYVSSADRLFCIVKKDILHSAEKIDEKQQVEIWEVNGENQQLILTAKNVHYYDTMFLIEKGNTSVHKNVYSCYDISHDRYIEVPNLDDGIYPEMLALDDTIYSIQRGALVKYDVLNHCYSEFTLGQEMDLYTLFREDDSIYILNSTAYTISIYSMSSDEILSAISVPKEFALSGFNNFCVISGMAIVYDENRSVIQMFHFDSNIIEETTIY